MGNSPARQQEKEKESGRAEEMAGENEESQFMASQKAGEERAPKERWQNCLVWQWGLVRPEPWIH